ncbi:MAG: LEA type 2 family protein [bacterium]|nr:LEA type 2 family protein [Candidatus Margulisiibacteriota bacterium]
MIKKAFFLLIIATISLALTSCAPQQPTVKFIEHKANSVTTDGVELTFLFEAENPNSLDVNVVSYKYKVFINDKELLSEVRGGFNIPRNSKKKILVPVMVRYDKLFGTAVGVLDALVGGDKKLSYKIEGTANIKFLELIFHVPINASGNIPIPKDITF